MAVAAAESGRALPLGLGPATDATRPVCIKSFGKQLSDRQRPPEQRMANRSKATTALMLAGGKWTAHDLRRTTGTLMARLGFSTDTINECLNHISADRMARAYIRDRRQADQARAFDALGAKLAESIDRSAPAPNVRILRARWRSAQSRRMLSFHSSQHPARGESHTTVAGGRRPL